MFALLLDANSYVNTINTWAEPHNANGVTPNSIIDSKRASLQQPAAHDAAWLLSDLHDLCKLL